MQPSRIFFVASVPQPQIFTSGFDCVNHKCTRPRYWGEATPFAFMARMMNSMSILIRDQLATYCECEIKCGDCAIVARQLSVNSSVCLKRGCNGRMSSMISESDLHSQLKYYVCLWDTDHVSQQLAHSTYMVPSNISFA
jgi:hypothetical protein